MKEFTGKVCYALGIAIFTAVLVRTGDHYLAAGIGGGLIGLGASLTTEGPNDQ